VLNIPPVAVGSTLGTIERKWLFCLTIILGGGIVAVWPEGLALLCYDRVQLINGELWRLATAHFVHLNFVHLLLNVLGLFLLCELQWGRLPLRHGFGLIAYSAIIICACLWWLQPELIRYAGLSGVLHGLWAGCTIYGLYETIDPARLCLKSVRLEPVERRGVFDKLSPNGVNSSPCRINKSAPIFSRLPYLVGAFLLVSKLLVEFLHGASAYTAHLIGGTVLTESHLYGALAGASYMLILSCVRIRAVSRGALQQH
jgi:rhomboid family GlyGly-CTERM serine protease